MGPRNLACVAFAVVLAATLLPSFDGATLGANDGIAASVQSLRMRRAGVAAVDASRVEYDEETALAPAMSSEWLWNTNVSIQYAHMSMLENLPGNHVAAAWQASQLHEGQCCASLGQVQSLWFSLSKDGGKSWSSPNIAVAGMTPAWGPVLHYEAKEQKLWLFYSLSMIDKSPGGDLVYRTTTDIDSENPKWSAPVVLWRSEDAEGQPKVTANKIAVMSNGDWVLPTWQESHYHGKTGVASVLIGRPSEGKDGRSWEVQGHLSNSTAGWLIEGTVAEVKETNGGSTLVQMFRTMDRRVWTARSPDGGVTWMDAAPIAELKNPNSKISITAVTDSNGQRGLVLAYNPSETARTPLVLAHSVDGRSWKDFALVENEFDVPGRFYAYPTVIQHGPELLVSYTVYDTAKKNEADEMIASAYPVPVPMWAANLRFKGMKMARVHLPDF